MALLDADSTTSGNSVCSLTERDVCKLCRELIRGAGCSKGMRTILVVEDYDDVRKMLRVLLETENFRVLEAASGIEALEVLEEERPHVIIMDLALPGFDELEAIRQIRMIDRFQNTPIIVLSAYAQPSTCEAAVRAGSNYFRAKPIDFEELTALLKEILSDGITRSSKRASSPPAVRRSRPTPAAQRPELTYRV